VTESGRAPACKARECVMFRADDFRHYAKECIEYARVSKPEEIRQHFLDMAKTWTLAAAQLEQRRNKLPSLTTSPEPTKKR
jgi:hypothetical protein